MSILTTVPLPKCTYGINYTNKFKYSLTLGMPSTSQYLQLAKPFNFILNAARGISSNGSISESIESLNKKERRSRRVPDTNSLKIIPGVGPKNEALLHQSGLTSIQDLLNFHHSQSKANSESTRQFLQDTVGIRNKNHVTSIVNFLSEQTAGTAATAPKVTLSVEGNISAGKSTFLRILEHASRRLTEKIQVVPEPVSKWQSVGEDKVNLLMEFYNAPERMAYTFQNYVFLTRMMQERQSYNCSQLCRLLERSVFSDRMVFVKAIYQAKHMNATELSIYDAWFDPVLDTLPTLVPDGFIYLRAEPETCQRRMQRRGRSEETAVPLDYLQELHKNHDDWLMRGSNSNVLTLPHSNQDLIRSPDIGNNKVNLTNSSLLHLTPLLKDRVKFLDAEMPGNPTCVKRLHGVPTLVLDCDEDADLDDVAYREEVAQIVDEYVVFMENWLQHNARVKRLNLSYSQPYFSIARDDSTVVYQHQQNGLLLPHQRQQELMYGEPLAATV